MHKIILLIQILLVFTSCVSFRKNINFTNLYEQKPLFLKNRFKYKIINDPQANNSCYIRFKVNAGILAQKDNEQGVAHLIQHLALRDEKSKSFLEKNNLSLQPDEIAATNNEDTIYSLDITCDENSIKEALFFLRHIAFELDFSSEAIKQEIAFINEEEIADTDQNEEISQKIINKLYHGTALANNSLFGSKEARKNFNAAQVNNFYKTWYRADNMELLLVGNFENQKINKNIKEFFKYDNPKTVLNKIDLVKPKYQYPTFVINNPDINNEVEVIFSLQPSVVVSEKFDAVSLKNREIFDLVINMLNQKFSAYAKKQELNYNLEVWGKYYYDNFFEFYFSTRSMTNNLSHTFKNDFKIIKEDFLQQEFLLAKNERKSSLENIINEEYSLNSYFIDLLMQDMHNDRPLWKKDYYGYLIKIIDEITLADCQNMLKNMFNSGNKHLFAIGDILENETSAQVLKETLKDLF